MIRNSSRCPSGEAFGVAGHKHICMTAYSLAQNDVVVVIYGRRNGLGGLVSAQAIRVGCEMVG